MWSGHLPGQLFYPLNVFHWMTAWLNIQSFQHIQQYACLCNLLRIPTCLFPFSHSALWAWPPRHSSRTANAVCIPPSSICMAFYQSRTIVPLGRISGIVLLHKQHLSPCQLSVGMLNNMLLLSSSLVCVPAMMRNTVPKTHHFQHFFFFNQCRNVLKDCARLPRCLFFSPLCPLPQWERR